MSNTAINMKILLALNIGLIALPAFAGAPICESLEGAIQKSCEYRVRAQELASRRWYLDAYTKISTSHLLNYRSGEEIRLIGDYAGGLVDSFRGKTFEQIRSSFPELNLLDADDLVLRSRYYSLRRDLAYAALEFTNFLDAVSLPVWADRVGSGNSAVDAITADQLQRLLRFQEFNVTDLEIATEYNLGGAQLALTCGVFYPFQFAYSAIAVAPLIVSTMSFADQECRIEGLRALVVQIFKGRGGVLTDSNFRNIPYTTNSATGESLAEPHPVLALRVLDPKLLRSVADSFVAYMGTKKTEATQEDLDRYITSINSLLQYLNVGSQQKREFYKGILEYVVMKPGKVYLRLGSRCADELKALGG